MKRFALSLFLALAPLAALTPALAQDPAAAEQPTASELLAAMDGNLQFDTRSSTTTMEVVDSRRTRSYSMITFGRGEDEAAIEYLAPERDKGTKMLKRGDNLWLYMPRAERVQKISGHMLRQGMMGSDISYEDMMQGSDFEEMYQATVVGSEELDGRTCWKIEAIARDETVSYPKRVIWVDAEWLVPTKQELFALSGMLLKTWTMTDVREIDGKQVPHRMEVSDALREGSKTVIHAEDVSFGIELEDEVFDRRWLERR